MKARVGRKSLTDASRIRRAGSIQSRLKVSGGITGGATPDPISNSEVKPSRADGTARSSVWESRTPPESSWAPDRKVWGLFLFSCCYARDRARTGLLDVAREAHARIDRANRRARAARRRRRARGCRLSRARVSRASPGTRRSRRVRAAHPPSRDRAAPSPASGTRAESRRARAACAG
jgi:hypothetical protein